jgi:cell division protein FtsL
MAENKFRMEAERGNLPREHSSGGGPAIFSGIEHRLKLENYFEEGFPVKYLPKILFIMMLGLLYISNTHHAEKTVRRIDQVQSEVEDLRADYTTLKSDLMFASKQSEVARKVKSMGLIESLNPPTKVVIEEGEY